MKSDKRFFTYDEQIDALKSKGCEITDEEFCQKSLSNIGYFRLKAYYLPFKLKDGTYQEGFSFTTVSRLYDFDCNLRSWLFPIIETIEVSIRARLVYFHSENYGPLGYLDADSFNKHHNHADFLEKIEQLKEQYDKLLFVKHYNEQHEGVFPLWVISELFTFGMTSRFYCDLKTSDKKRFAGTDYELMVSWLRCCSDLRNICAHHGRIYYRVFTAMPAGFNIDQSAARRFWGAVLSVKALYPYSNQWNNELVPILVALIDEFKNDINLYHLAFPKDWESQLRK